jgi:signal recognition particle receptor subunit beta
MRPFSSHFGLPQANPPLFASAKENRTLFTSPQAPHLFLPSSPSKPRSPHPLALRHAATLSNGNLPQAGALESDRTLCYKYWAAKFEEIVPFINFPAREINCKLVYYGPGLGGKTANLQWIYEHTGTNQKGKMVSLATETDRTLFFDFLPLDLGTVRGFRTRFHLYTVPGQVFYEASRRLILKGADGVVFVADSQEERLDANLETLDNLREHLKDHNLDFTTIPYVLQLNKRDLPNILSVDDLKKELNVKGESALEAVAITGQGVFDTLKEVAKLVLAELKKNS